MWDDSDTLGVINNVYVNHAEVRRAARAAETAGQSVSTGPLISGGAAAVSAVPGGMSAPAFGEVIDVLESRLAAFRVATQGWADEVQAAVAAYEEADVDAADGLSRTRWQAV